MFAVTVLAVTKVIVAVLVGAYTANTIPFRDSTIRDFSYLISNVLLPCITVANTAKSVTLDVLIRCSVLPFFAFLLICVGVATSMILSFTMFRPPERGCGIPLDMQKDVHFELCYEAVEEQDESQEESPTGSSTARTEKKKPSKGRPYVAVVLSEALRARGVTGEDVVPLLDVPSPEMEAQPGYFWGSLVGCSIQNTVTLPLSLLQNLSESVPWVQFEQGSAYIFVFSTVCTLYLWSFGPSYVETAQKQSEKLRLIREIMMQHKRRTQQCDACTQTEVVPNSSVSPVARDGAVPQFPPRTASNDGCPLPRASVSAAAAAPATSSTTSFPDSNSAYSQATHQCSQVDFGSPTTVAVPKFFVPTAALCEQLPYDWVQEGLLRPVYAADMAATTVKQSRAAALLKTAKSVGWRLLTNVPFMAIVVSILIGITPPVRALFFDGGMLEMFMESIAMISQGCVPSSLLLLGVNLAGSTGSQVSQDANANRQLRHSEQNTDFPLHAQDLELIGEDAAQATAYNEQHAHLASDGDNEDRSDAEFDPYATFSLQDLIQESADARVREMQERQRSRLAALTVGDCPDGVMISDDAGTQTGTRSSTAGAVAEEAAPPPSASVLSRVMTALNVEGVRKLFIWGTIAIRLVILPAISFLVLVMLIKTVPSLFGADGEQDKTLILVLFLELAAPTAINSALLFNQRQYMTYPWAKMLFFQYILCSFTLVMWATVGLATVEAL